MWTIIDVTFTVLEAIIKIWFITKFFGYKSFVSKRKTTFLCMIAIQSAFVIILNNICVFEGLYGFAIYVTVLFIYALIFLKGNVLSKVLVSCAIELSIFVISAVTIMTISVLSGKGALEVISNTYSFKIFSLLITMFMKCFAAFLVIRIKADKSFILKKSQFIIFIASFLISVAVLFSSFELVLQISMDNTNIKNLLIISFGIIGISAFEFYFLFFADKQNKKALEYELQKVQLEEQQKRIKQIDLEYKNISVLRHDFTNWISCAVNLIDSGEPQKAKEYLEKLLKNKVTNTVKYVNLGNNPVTSVINIKLNECIKNGIEIKYVINAAILSVDEMDLCILIANIFDNAIEAEKSIIKPVIDFKLENKKNYLCILLKNKIQSSVLGKNPKLKTTKADKENHGFGKKSIDGIIEISNGIIDYYEENDFFCCRIMLPQKGDV